MESRAQRLPPDAVLLTLAGEPFPDMITRCGHSAGRRFVEFFTEEVKSPAMRMTYAQAVVRFCSWADRRGHTVEELTTIVISIYVEQLGLRSPLATVKQHLAAVRLLFDWFVISGIVTANPVERVPDPELGLHAEDLLKELQSDLDLELRLR